MSEKWEATGSPVSEAIARERETRHWTIGQRREALGESWPGESARITHEADEAVDELLRENDEYEQLANSMLDALLDLVEAVSPGPYLEMFSRRARLGWQTWGDEALHGTEAVA